MSWTSEQEPPPSQPPEDGDWTAAANGADPSTEPDEASTDIPEDGPLDPSVFDGLFDDLVDDDPAPADDNPLEEFLAVTLTGDLDDADLRVAEAADPGSDDQAGLAGLDARPADTGALGDEVRDLDGSFATSSTDLDSDLDLDLDLDLDSDLDLDLDLDSDLDLDLDADPALDSDPVMDDDRAFDQDQGPGPEAVADDGATADLDHLGQPLPPAMPSRGEELWTDETDDIDAIGLDGGGADEHDIGLDGDDRLDGESDEVPHRDLHPVDMAAVDADHLDDGHPPAQLDDVDEFDDLDDVDEFDDFDEFDRIDRFDGDGEEFRPGAGPLRDEPLAASPALRAEDGPVRASPPIQHDPRPEPDPVTTPATQQEELAGAVVDGRSGRSQRVLTALVAAVIVGGGIGIGGAVLLSRIVDRGDAAPATAAATGADAEVETAAAAEGAPPVEADAQATSLQIASLRFDRDAPDTIAPGPGTDVLTAAIEGQPDAPIVATIRTFTEATAADDLAQSRLQAEALTTQLVELGANPDRVSVVGLGRSLLSGAQPVPNFVVPTAGLEPSRVAEVAADIGPFAIGIDPRTGTLRRESVAALDALAAALLGDEEGRGLTLAAYSFDRADRSENDRQAQLLGDAAVARLVEVGVDPSRITTIVAGDEPFAVPDRVANHIDLTWGDQAEAALALNALPIDAIDFEEGSAELDQESQATVDALATLLVDNGANAVIDVHSFDGEVVQDRVDLSVSRAQAIGQRLLAAGVPANQLRLHGGTSAQFRGEGRVCRVVVTVLQPPAQS